MGEGSRVACGIRWDRDGKQLGSLRVPWSRNRSAWGSVEVPIAYLRNGAGPTVLLTAGAHGDEYEGPLALCRLLRELSPDDLSGSVIVLPMMNVPALRTATRLCPIDGRDLNRSFPGDRSGTYTSMLAHFIATELVPRAELVLDLHSGGTSLWFSPCAVAHHLPDPAMHGRTMAALRAFGAPLGLILHELDDAGQLDTFVEQRGIVFLSTELAGGGMVTKDAVRIAHEGALRLLAHTGVLAAGHPSVTPAPTTLLVEVPDATHYVLAPADGVFEPDVDLGDEVLEDQLLGHLVFLDDLTRPPLPLLSPRSGAIIAKRPPAQTDRGDPLLVLARRMDDGA